MELSGVRAVVTGAASGLGEAVARAYADAGAHVACLDLDDRGGEAVVASLAGGRGRHFHCDVSDTEAVDARFTEAVDWMGGIDVLVHAAAYDAGSKRSWPSEDLTVDDVRRVLDVNVCGTILVNQAAFHRMRTGGGGSIVNFHSLAGIRGAPRMGAYAASKGAVGAWTRTVAAEWAPHNVRVNAIAPVAQTPRAEAFRQILAQKSPEALEEYDQMMARSIPLGGKLGDPLGDVAPFLVFLASPGAHYITGQTFSVDGGMLMMSA